MLALQDRPTPVPTGDVDDDCATQIWRGSPIVGDGEGTPARASTSVAVAHDRRAPSEPPVRDTIVDPPPSPPSLWARFKAAAGRFADAIESAFFGTAPLSTKLPPLPPPARSPEQTLVSAGPLPDHEHGEAMLRDLLRAPLPHQRAAIEVARWAIAARRCGERAYADFVVHFMLSRMRPDKDNRIEVSRLRDTLCHVPYEGVVVPALIRLEDQGVVALVIKRSDDPMASIQREGITHVELCIRI